MWGADAASAGTIELGDQRAARIGRNGRDRSDARAEAEAMQRERGCSTGIDNSGIGGWALDHASMSLLAGT
jgi:hypothetical protein